MIPCQMMRLHRDLATASSRRPVAPAMLRPLLLTMAVAGVALLWAACGGGASSFQPGVINCEPLFESQRYRFELRVLVDLKEFSGEPTDDDRYPPEGFKLDQVISGIADEGNIDATIRYPDLD